MINTGMPLTKIGLFNPSRLNDEEIELSFSSRIPFFKYLFNSIIEEAENSIPQHYLIIGQRGMGKTSLLLRIAVELRKKPYAKTFIALSFPEEQYNIDKLTKFWLNCLDALADALDKENNIDLLKELDTAIGKLVKENISDPNSIYDYFKTWCAKTKRRPVLLIDNFNLLLNKISKEEAHQLRAILISNNAPILVGASTDIIAETVNYDAPFYDAFKTSYLKKLTFAESVEVLQNLAKLTNNNNFTNLIASHKGRLEAIYQLTGGTPRTINILYPLIQNGFSINIQTDLDALLDAVTPLYKAKFEELSDQLQVILDAIALHWAPINLEQIRTITALENATLSPQLKRLVALGWLQKLTINKAKGSAYELTERFFNVWYLMRRSSRRQKRELYCLTKFLESFYGNTLEDLAQNRIAESCENKNSITLNLALAEAVKNESTKSILKNKSYDAILSLSKTDDAILNEFKLPVEYTSKKGNELRATISLFLKNRQYAEIEEPLKELFNLNKQNANVLGALGELYQVHLGKNEAAEEAYKKAIAIDENYVHAYYGLGILYKNQLGKYEEAEEAYKKAIAIDEKYVDAYNNLGNLYKNHLGKYEAAEEAYKKAIAIDEKYVDAYNGLGNLYQVHLGKYEAAKEAYQKAIAIDEKYVDAYNGLGNLYQDHLGKYEEAEEAYKKAIAIDEKYIHAYNGLGNLYQYHLGKYEAAEEAYKKAIAIDEKYVKAYNALGNLYQFHLGKYEAAEEAYRKAIAIDDNYVHSYDGLGNLYQDHLGKYEAAEEAYRKAIAIDNKNVYPVFNLIFLLRDKMNKIDEASILMKTVVPTFEIQDAHLLHKAIFAFYEKNIGVGEKHLTEAITLIGETLPNNTKDDWYRTAAIIVKLGYGYNLLQIFKTYELDVIMSPFYAAIEALIKMEDPLFLNNYAIEIRTPAKQIMEIMQKYMG